VYKRSCTNYTLLLNSLFKDGHLVTRSTGLWSTRHIRVSSHSQQ